MIAEDLGRLFEVGFNIGILTAIAQADLPHNFGDRYQRDLHRLEFPRMVDRICRKSNIIDPGDRDKVETWGLFLLQKGWLSGLNFFREYLQSLGKYWYKAEILYYQCSFAGKNSIGLYNKDERQEVREWLSQLGNEFTTQLDSHLRRYLQKGEFLRADTLILLRLRKKLRILVVDLSVFSVRQATDLLDLKDKNLDTHRRLLQREVSYLKSKSVFAMLRLDTGEDGNLDFEFSENLTRYFTAFKRQDKESAKLIQAGSYGYSFYRFLQNFEQVQGKAIAPDNIRINVVGYSDRSLSIMSLHPQHSQHLNLLETCHRIYTQEPRDEEIRTARTQLLQIIRRNVARSFQDGKVFAKNLTKIQPDRINCIPPHREVIENFKSTRELRSPHAEAVQNALDSDKTFLFLTGNPGIGKTTAIVEYLKSKVDEGFLFFYVSPRKQVNLDIIEKFKNAKTGKLCDDRLFCITTDATVIDEHNDRKVVKYVSGQHRDVFSSHGIQFIPLDDPPPSRSPSSRSIERVNDRELVGSDKRKPGVLSTLCEGIYNAINDPISNTIVATSCIQSLRITGSGQNTLEHLNTIFKGFYNEREGTVNYAKMRELSGRIKHIFIAIDEITGDDSGVEFLHGVKKIIEKYKLANPESGLNTKAIVADASIVEGKAIEQHLKDTSPEPDKIFVRQVRETPSNLGISCQSFKFKKHNAIAINANSYPAKRLAITYKPFVESIRFDPDRSDDLQKELSKKVRQEILDDLNELRHSGDRSQILVYIQNKQRLQELIETIQAQEKFVKWEDYLEIHANLSDEDRQEIHTYRDKVRVIFMTSSASRGLSFPKSQHILVEVPQFQVEKNLMEIIQVIYRCRGQFWDGRELKTLDDAEKSLTFYLRDRAVYYGDDDSRDLSVQESVLSLFNLLVILKTAIMTRIRGYGKIGRHNFMMIPIGGKSVFSSGQSLSGQLAKLVRDLHKEHRRNPRNTTILELADGLQNLLSRGEFLLRSDNRGDRSEMSYLNLRDEFNLGFAQRCDRLDGLLELPNIEPGHVCGSLLLVPISQKTLLENYEMRLSQINRYATSEILDQMFAIREGRDYPPSLKALMKRGIDLIRELRKPHEYTQRLQQQSSWSDQYYAIPLFAFLVGNIICDYFKSDRTEPDKGMFRQILNSYIRQLYPCDRVLPIGDRYRDFPFLIFRSYSLQQMRSQLFTHRYLLTSNELNILNLILGVDDRERVRR